MGKTFSHIYTQEECFIKIRAFYEKKHRVPSDFDFRYNAKKYDIPSHNTLKKLCPFSLDIIISKACKLDSFPDSLKKLIKSYGNKDTIYFRASDLVPFSQWANSYQISSWVFSNIGAAFHGYYLAIHHISYTGNGSLYMLSRGV